MNTYMYYARLRATDIALLSLPQRHPSKRDSKTICAGPVRRVSHASPRVCQSKTRGEITRRANDSDDGGLGVDWS